LLLERTTGTLSAAMARSRIVLSLVLGLAVAAIDAAPAVADTSTASSNITAPAGGSELFYDGDSNSGSVTVSGTITGTDFGTDGDLLCYDRADGESFTLMSAIPVVTDSFSVNVSLAPIAGRACRLRLVPSGFVHPLGASAARFVGPAISVSDRFSHSSDGNLWGYDILTGTLPWSFELESLGECPVLSSFATDPLALGSFELFAGNACLPAASGIAPNFSSRSALQVDNLNAYPPGAIGDLTALAGFQPLSYAPTFDANHDEVTISESDNAMICTAPGLYPPTPTNCPTLSPAGIQIVSRTSLYDGGQVARVGQTVKNVDDRTHTVDLLFGQSVSAPSNSAFPGFEFPGQETFAAHSAPDSYSAFPKGASSIIVLSDASSTPSVSNPIGAITYNHPPTSANFVSGPGSPTATFLMHYTATLRPGQSAAYDWSFSQSSGAGNLSELEQIERDRFVRPKLKISHPAKPVKTRRRRLTVSGSVSDAIGVRSVTVAGQPAKITGRRFSTTIRLRPGRHRVQVRASNEAGNTRTASVTVTYNPRPCTVPALRGHKLAAARKALAAHDCRAGKVVRVRSRRVRKGRVVRTRPAAGVSHKPFWKVRLYVSAGAGGQLSGRKHGGGSHPAKHSGPSSHSELAVPPPL
jgi:hypothetical protein